ncbi:hypothetical protein BDV96DRAFT_602408 [Lophiotrema nucula]|uniref:Uncharacterized protein n=1 Tax=Lophiotrema nucula TaxID=690887 RepID=A0A6A5YYF9_9PLEO|nr:hypothetical protein BDV96DRAFT_602408 [Lophiotrema nucula]
MALPLIILRPGVTLDETLREVTVSFTVHEGISHDGKHCKVIAPHRKPDKQNMALDTKMFLLALVTVFAALSRLPLELFAVIFLVDCICRTAIKLESSHLEKLLIQDTKDLNEAPPLSTAMVRYHAPFSGYHLVFTLRGLEIMHNIAHITSDITSATPDAHLTVHNAMLHTVQSQAQMLRQKDDEMKEMLADDIKINAMRAERLSFLQSQLARKNNELTDLKRLSGMKNLTIDLLSSYMYLNENGADTTMRDDIKDTVNMKVVKDKTEGYEKQVGIMEGLIALLETNSGDLKTERDGLLRQLDLANSFVSQQAEALQRYQDEGYGSRTMSDQSDQSDTGSDDDELPPAMAEIRRLIKAGKMPGRRSDE